jgi:23S rRNA (uracil1939-C5)-methyltransferase
MFRKDRVLDLFCGMGNFTLPLARKAASVVGVEGVEALVAKGQENARRMVAKCDILSSKSGGRCHPQPWAKQGFDKILLDPARAGAPGVMHIL